MLGTWRKTGAWRVADRVTDLRFDSSTAVSISSPDKLQALQPAFVRSMSAELGVESLAAKVCPVLLADHTLAIFALAAHVGSDQADALVQRLQINGYALAIPQRYVLPAPLLLAIGRQQLTVASLSGHALLSADQARTDLAEAFQDMVAWGVTNQASDLHINIFAAEAESEVRFTVSGRYLSPERFARIPTRTLSDMLAVAWMEVQGGNGAVFDPRIEQQGSLQKTIDGKPVLLRWASLPADRGPSVCLRILPRMVPANQHTLDSLGYLPQQVRAIERAAQTSGGAIVFAGNVGSGKSTSLATLISGLPGSRKVITIEDPVEYLIPHAVQNTVSRGLEASAHHSFSAKLRTLKRSAMNDVLLGEIRDQETGRAFMDLASSGVSVYTTTHAPSAVAVGERLASDFIGVSRDFLSTPGMLKLLVYQALLPQLCSACALAFVPPSSTWGNALRQAYGGCVDGLRQRNPQGCEQCQNKQLPQQNGYLGRTVAAEYIEPEQMPQLLVSIKQADGLRFLLQRPAPRFKPEVPPAMGQPAMHCAMYKSLKGQIDPVDIERAFRPFGTPALPHRRRWQTPRAGLRRRLPHPGRHR